MTNPLPTATAASPGNRSTEVCPPAAGAENVLLGFYYILVFLVALSGNGLALWVFSRQKGPASPSHVFLTHLAVADLSYVVILPLRATYHLTWGHWPFGDVACRVAGFLFFVNMYASLYFLACVAADRYVAVVHAASSVRLRRARSAHLLALALWALVIAATAPLLAGRQTAEVGGATACLQLYREGAGRRALVSLAAAFAPPFLITLTCYALLAGGLRGGAGSARGTGGGARLRALRTVAAVVLVYVACFLPYHVGRAAYVGARGRPGGPCSLAQVNRLTSALTCLNAAMDPLVYLLGAQKFRGAARKLLCRGGTGGSGGSGSSAAAAPGGDLKGTRDSSLSAKTEL